MKRFIFVVIAVLFTCSLCLAEDMSEKERAKYEIRALAAEANAINLKLQVMKTEFESLVSMREAKVAELDVWKGKLKEIEEKEKAAKKDDKDKKVEKVKKEDKPAKPADPKL